MPYNQQDSSPPLSTGLLPPMGVYALAIPQWSPAANIAAALSELGITAKANGPVFLTSPGEGRVAFEALRRS